MSPHDETPLPRRGGCVQLVLGISLLVLAAALTFWLAAGLARGADPLPCELGYELRVGEAERCVDHTSIPKVKLEKLLAAMDERDQLRADLAKATRDHAIELAKARAGQQAAETLLSSCQARATPKPCPEPGAFARPEVAWPGGLVLGFFAGFAVDRWALPR